MSKGWFSHSGQSLFVEYEGILRKCDARDGAVLRQTEIKGLGILSASPDGRWVATVDEVPLDGSLPQSTIELRDASTLQPVHQWLAGAEASIARTSDSATLRFHADVVCFSADSNRRNHNQGTNVPRSPGTRRAARRQSPDTVCAIDCYAPILTNGCLAWTFMSESSQENDAKAENSCGTVASFSARFFWRLRRT